ncbi:unnamed protein product [Boreogadus saida]
MSHHRLLIAHPRNHIAAPCVAFRATSVLSESILAGVEPLPASPLHLTVLPPCTQLATLESQTELASSLPPTSSHQVFHGGYNNDMAEAERAEGGGAQRQMLKVLRVCQTYRRFEKPCSTERRVEMPRATKRCVKQTDGHKEEQAESCCVQSHSGRSKPVHRRGVASDGKH